MRQCNSDSQGEENLQFHYKLSPMYTGRVNKKLSRKKIIYLWNSEI